jgi:hypothetical protein
MMHRRGAWAKPTKHLTINVLFKLGDPMPTETVYLRRVYHAADGVDGLLVDQELDFGEFAFPPASIFVVKRGITLAVAIVSCFHSMNKRHTYDSRGALELAE